MKFKEGNQVEVFRRKEEQCGSWFPAKILLVDEFVCTVRYELLLTSDGKAVVESVQKEDVRPYPPPLNHKEIWNVGDIAEALDLCSWRVGKVVKVLKFDRVVIRSFGSIQIKVQYVSDLRVPQVWQNGQWIVTDKESGRNQSHHECTQSIFDSAKKLDGGTSERIDKQASNGCGSKQKHVACSSTIRTTSKRNSDCHLPFSPIDLANGTDKKRKSSTDQPQKLTTRAPPIEVDANSFSKDMATMHLLHKSSRDTIARTHMNADIGYTYNRVMNASSILLRDSTKENDECSVASCSANEYPVSCHQNLIKHPKGTAITDFDESMSPCLSQCATEYQSKNEDEFAVNVHKLELHAYQSTMQALHASGPLSWEQESLLTNLRLCLNISNEEHLLHLRHLLSA